MKGVRISEAHLFVAASMPKETPHTTETRRVITIRVIVLNVYNGRFLISSYGRKVMISQVIRHRIANPTTELTSDLRNPHSPT